MSEILRCEFCHEKMADGYFDDRIAGEEDEEFYLVSTYSCSDCAKQFIQRGEKFHRFYATSEQNVNH